MNTGALSDSDTERWTGSPSGQLADELRRSPRIRSPRIRRLREALLEAPYGLCSQKAELLTEYFRSHAPIHPITRLLAPSHFAAVRRAMARNLNEGTPQSAAQLRVSRMLQKLYARLDSTAGEPPVISYARGLAYVLERVPLRIHDDELIVGNLSSHRIGAPIHPDFGGLLLLPELRHLADRPVNPLRTSPAQIRRLEEDIFPFWFTRSVMTRAPLLASDDQLQNTLVRGRQMILTQFAGISHVTPDYRLVLERGFEGILADIERARRDAADDRRSAFYQAAEIVAHAAIAFAGRWSAHCRAAAAAACDAQRAAELETLAAIFERVPAGPATTLHEALQSLFLTHVMVHQESFQHGVSFGRVDQYLYPYYRRDVAAGTLTREQAVELLGCFLAKAAEQVPLFNSMATEFFSGLSSASGVTLGGVGTDGNDATNELSYLFLDAYDQLRLRQPNLHLRIHEGSPYALRARAYEVLKRGGGMPAFFNDDGVIHALEEAGAAAADARDYSIVGCVEWGVPAKSFPAAGAVFISLPAVLDDVLHDAARGGGADRSTMNEIVAAFRVRLSHVIDDAVAGNNAIERAHALFRPTPLLSLLVDGCIETGVDVTAGGARYNSTGIQGVGLADVADSLAAIDQVVFIEHRAGLRELVTALDANFEGYEELRSRLLYKTPKYGRDDDGADDYARLVARTYCALAHARRNGRGGAYMPGFWTMTTHVGFGRRLGALPSGRKAGAPLADGISPANGADFLGPTASLLSAAKVCSAGAANGVALNAKLDPRLVKGEAGNRLIDALTRGYFAAGGLQVQYNVVDARVLIDAKHHPERHRDLVVRVSGYSAYFNDLTEEMKDDVIARTLHGSVDDRPACQSPASVRSAP